MLVPGESVDKQLSKLSYRVFITWSDRDEVLRAIIIRKSYKQTWEKKHLLTCDGGWDYRIARNFFSDNNLGRINHQDATERGMEKDDVSFILQDVVFKIRLRARFLGCKPGSCFSRVMELHSLHVSIHNGAQYLYKYNKYYNYSSLWPTLIRAEALSTFCVGMATLIVFIGFCFLLHAAGFPSRIK